MENELAAGLYQSDKDSALQLLRSSIIAAEKISYRTGLYKLWFTKAFIHLQYNQLDSAFIGFSKAKEIASDVGDEIGLIRALNALSYCVQNKRKGIPYLEEALEIATAIGDKEKQAAVMTSLGIAYSNLAEFDSAEIYYIKALAIHKEKREKKPQADILRNLGNNAGRSNNLAKALSYYQQAVLIMRELEKKSEEAGIYNMMGYACSVFGNFPKALEYSHIALKLMEAAGDREGIADCYNRISDLYLSLEDYSQALFFVEKSYALQEEQGKSALQPDLLYRKGYIYKLKGEYRAALQFLRESLALKNAIGQTVSSRHFYDLGYCFGQLGQPDSALVFFQNALHIGRETNIPLDIAESLIGLANIHFQQEDFEMAIAELKEAIELATISGKKEQEMAAAEILYRIYKNRNDTKEALYYHETYRGLQDSLFNEKNTKEIARMEAGFEFEKEKQELEFAQQRRSAKEASVRRILWVALGLVGMALAIGIFYFRSKQKANAELNRLNKEILTQKAVVEEQKEKLEELDIAKSRFFTNISHEFRTPLTVINGMAGQIEGQEKIKSLIRRNSLSLLNLVNQILDLRKLELGKLKLELVQGDVVQYLQYVLESYEVMAGLKGVKLHFIPKEKELFMDFDQEKLLRIVTNLLFNAIKFTPEGGHVYLMLEKSAMEKEAGQRAEALYLRVSDTGVGIPKEKQAYIFDRFYQVEENSGTTGAGIGLALTKDLITLMGGSISLESAPGKGSSFTVLLPISREANIVHIEQQTVEELTLVEFDQLELERTTEPFLKKVASTEKENGLSLLIIEDNRDVQQYLITLLESKYTLYLAGDGEEGIEMAFEHIPDLIISDVMMPKKDGFEVCDTLKNDDRTSHIPIILLTAKGSVESRIQGLERGADAYLAKPFNEKELFVRLEKLTELRRLLQQRYQHIRPPADAVQAAPETGFEKEDAIMAKLQKIVEDNLDDTDFGPTQLCKAMGMSRSHLHLKIKALTNLSTSIFIRTIRLYKAKELLQKGELNVTQVAYEVGFNDLSYFSRKFSEEFGVNPQKVAKS
ncbi:MAG: tetratricopeptide repeat protein [Lewinellaceae bacterium]|nr:tetratricopeptide repeat protein [Lewinellaceae bacterium]